MSDWKPNLYVVARFLDALAEGSRSRSELQVAAGVNYDIFRRYLAFLEARAYVSLHADGAVVMTAEGRRVRAELRAWIERFLGAEARDPRPTGARGRPGDAPARG